MEGDDKIIAMLTMGGTIMGLFLALIWVVSLLEACGT